MDSKKKAFEREVQVDWILVWARLGVERLEGVVRGVIKWVVQEGIHFYH